MAILFLFQGAMEEGGEMLWEATLVGSSFLNSVPEEHWNRMLSCQSEPGSNRKRPEHTTDSLAQAIALHKAHGMTEATSWWGQRRGP